MAEPHDRKPILTIEQQIEHLKQKGVAFELCSEEEAADYLRDKCNFFKLASYRKLFSKYEGGPRDGRYVDLDFGQLRLLAALDQELRHALLGMTLDIEHFQKVTLLREMEDRGEDGYAIVADYMASLTTANREYRLRELKMSGRSPYSSSLYAKYSGDMPAWAFLELTSFGTLIDFVRFCARRWGDRRLEASHYDLKRVKSVRNCAAHGSCLINCFAERAPPGARRPAASPEGSPPWGFPRRPGGSGWGIRPCRRSRPCSWRTPAWYPRAPRARAPHPSSPRCSPGPTAKPRRCPTRGPTPQLAPRSSSFAG